jgi:multidrug efflux pump
MSVAAQSGQPSQGPRGSLASFFIARPIFAIVLAIATMFGGIIGIYSLPISQYPEIAPTTVRVSASYPGATAEAVENSVTTEIEKAMTGLDGLLYMESSSSTGSASVTLTFGNSVDPDIVQVDVQNKLSPVLRRLPQSVQRQGVRVSRSSSDILMIGNIISTDSKYTTFELSDIMSNQIEKVIERVEGVGGLQAFGTGYAMRIWLDPLALQQFQLTPNDVTAAIEVQNVQVTAGAIGSSPTVPGQHNRAEPVEDGRSIRRHHPQIRAGWIDRAIARRGAGRAWPGFLRPNLHLQRPARRRLWRTAGKRRQRAVDRQCSPRRIRPPRQYPAAGRENRLFL